MPREVMYQCRVCEALVPEWAIIDNYVCVECKFPYDLFGLDLVEEIDWPIIEFDFDQVSKTNWKEEGF